VRAEEQRRIIGQDDVVVGARCSSTTVGVANAQRAPRAFGTTDEICVFTG
jgi:hypothetical protein